LGNCGGLEECGEKGSSIEKLENNLIIEMVEEKVGTV
jgi:hypothetical protein